MNDNLNEFSPSARGQRVSHRIGFERDGSGYSVVPDGPRFHEQRVRQFGMLMSLTVPAIAGVAALVLLYGSQSAWRGIVGFTAALIALPTMPIFGLPVTTGPLRWALTITTSIALWLFLGHVAARRAVRKMASSWPEWRQQWWPLAFGAWSGALIGMALAGGYLLIRS
jgi:hypothetical protein